MNVKSIILWCVLALGLTSSAVAQDASPPNIVAAMGAATERFAGQIVAAQLEEGRPHEQAEAVFEFRMLTANGDILRIRVDAATLDILEVDGHGLVSARKPVAQ